MKPGPRELELRALREQQAADDKAAKKKLICRIDHDGPEATVPRELCRICNPELGTPKAVPTMTQKAEAIRDFRIPKGMSDEEGKAMLARRAEERKAKSKERNEKLKQAKAEKKALIVAKANEKRLTTGLPVIEASPLEEKDTDMAKKSKTAKKAKASKNGHETRKGSKSAKIAELLLRSSGTTNKEVLKATGWPTISMPAIAKSLGIKLRKEKTGDGMRYYGSR